MWTAVWEECKKSPVIGHGYFVTSETGKLKVWYEQANHTAHNVYLQVLVSTGVIGLCLFLTAIARPWLAFQKLRRGDQQAAMVYQMLSFLFIWYFGWSLLCASFMGPVRSESVVFFTFLGIGLGQLARRKELEESVPAHP
jgi:O-antigen ligase